VIGRAELGPTRRFERCHGDMALTHCTLVEAPSQAERAAAQRLLSRQAEYHARLDALLDSFPPSGLYADEDKDSFERFVEHVRSVLAASPRAMLLRSLDAALRAAAEEGCPATAALFSALGLRRGTPLIEVAAALAQSTPGRLHHQWVSAVEASCKKTLDDRVRGRIRDGYARKAAVRGGPPPRPSELAAVLAEAEAAGAAGREDAARRAAELWPRVEEDAQYRRYTAARALWGESRARALWAQFEGADLEEGEERRRRGGRFERGQAQACVALIAAKLGLCGEGGGECGASGAVGGGPAGTTRPAPDTGAAHTATCGGAEGRSGSWSAGGRGAEVGGGQGDGQCLKGWVGRGGRRISAVRGAVWTDAFGTQVGEVDLVLFEEWNEAARDEVLWNERGAGEVARNERGAGEVVAPWQLRRGCAVAGRVLALCEMKAGCLEIASALGQHEPKLLAAQRGGRHAPLLRAGPGKHAPLLSLLSGAPVPVFVATLLPPHPFAIGAEPALIRALGQALYPGNAQRVTRNRIRPRAVSAGERTPTGQPAAGAAAVSGAADGPTVGPGLEALEAQVRAAMGRRLALSPLGFLRNSRGAERVLVLGQGEASDTSARDWMRAAWGVTGMAQGAGARL